MEEELEREFMDAELDDIDENDFEDTCREQYYDLELAQTGNL
jgi:hypothetical protein